MVEFLDSEYISAREFTPYPIVHDDTNAMSNRLWEFADWKKKVFGIKGVSKYKVNAFFFQLVGTGILTFKWVNATTGVVCAFGTDDKNRIKYKNTLNWKGISFRKASWDGGTVEFNSILQSSNKNKYT